MSNIQELIDTIKQENFENREISLNIDAVNQNTQIGWLEMIYQNLSELRDGFYQYMDDERERFIEQQKDQKAARRAEAERLKEAQAKGFVTPVNTEEDDTPTVSSNTDDEGGFFKKLGIAGLLASIGAALSGYVAGIVNNLIKFITLGKFDGPKIIAGITKAMTLLKETVMLNVFRLQYFLESIKLPKPSMPQGLVNAGKSITAFFTENKIGKFLSNVGNLLKTIGASLVSVFDMRPLMDAVRAIGGGPKGGILKWIASSFKYVGGILRGVFTLAAQIAKPITAIIFTVKALFDSFKEFEDDMSLFEKLMITVKNVFKELTSAFVTMPLELIKAGISTIAGWLGFDGVEEYLDSFDIDQIFRDSVDSIFNSIKDAINYVSDLIYQGKRKLGLADVDPEAEARIAARKVSGTEDDLAEADAKVQQLEETISTSSSRSERNEARRQLENARSQRDDRETDLQEAQQSAAEAQVFGATALDESTQDASLQAAIDSGLYVQNPLRANNISISKLEETTDVDQLKAIINDDGISPRAKQMVLDRIQELDSPAPSATATTSTAAPRVEPLVPLTFASAATDSADSLLEGISSPFAAGDISLGALSGLGETVMGGALSAVFGGEGSPIDNIMSGQVADSITPANGLGTAPIAAASKQVAAAAAQPQVVAVSGGSNQTIQNNSSNIQQHHYGAMSARTTDHAYQRNQDRNNAYA